MTTDTPALKPLKRPAFLTAEWRYLLMLNYQIEPTAIKPFVPLGTELDDYGGKTYVSIVGFQFLRTRVRGIAFPFHRDFEEVNLRFYVRRKVPEGWRRGVVFVRELVPRWAIAVVARNWYGEPYLSVPMRHTVRPDSDGTLVKYEWRRNGQWESVGARIYGEPRGIAPGSIEEFITEHYWGYTACRDRCSEYEVEHPKWRVWSVKQPKFTADVGRLYGPPFVSCLAQAPNSAFVAEGSAVTVRSGAAIGGSEQYRK